MLKVVNFYRVARYLHSKGIPIMPNIIDYLIRLIFSCWFPHTIKAGNNLVLGYGGLGVVVHANAKLGDNVHIDQNVTIGGNGVAEGVPDIQDNVYIGAGAIVIGPITVGKGSVIGANSVVTKDVSPNSVVAGIPAKEIKKNIDISQYLHHLKNKK